MIVLNTCKGKGCTFAEGILNNHHIAFTCEQADEALDAATKLLRDLNG
jgi:transketolase